VRKKTRILLERAVRALERSALAEEDRNDLLRIDSLKRDQAWDQQRAAEAARWDDLVATQTPPETPLQSGEVGP